MLQLVESRRALGVCTPPARTCHEYENIKLSNDRRGATSSYKKRSEEMKSGVRAMRSTGATRRFLMSVSALY